MDYSVYGTYGSDTAAVTGLLAVVGGILIFVGIIGLIVAIITLIGLWKMFKKAGEEGWKAIIPIYNVYTLCKIVGVNPWWILIVCLSPILAKIPVIGSLAQLAISIYFSILLCVSVARSYGKDTGFAILTFFFTPICYCILGFGSSQYVGAKPMNDFIFKNNGSTTTTATPTAAGKKCPSCGADVPAGSAFCTGCGSKVD